MLRRGPVHDFKAAVPAEPLAILWLYGRAGEPSLQLACHLEIQ